jgi:predicted O-methyltransferase YrrM
MKAIRTSSHEDLRALVSAAWTLGRSINTSHCLYGQRDHEHMAYYGLLAGLTRLIDATTVLEIGTCHGGSALAFEAGLPDKSLGGTVVSVDIEDRGCPALHEHSRIKCVLADFPAAGSLEAIGAALQSHSIDILFVDALKNEEFLLAAVESGLKWNPALIVCDDVMANPSMQSAWTKLSANPRFAASLRCCEALQGIRTPIYDMGFLLCQHASKPQHIKRAKDINAASFAARDLEHIGYLPPSMASCFLPGMINDKERQLYYHIASRCLQRVGQIVDAGCFLGASTRVLTGGLRANGSGSDIRVHAFDLFRNTSKAYDRFLTPPPPRNSDLLPCFINNIRPVADLVNIYPGNFLDARWTGQPIELCFVDIAKSPQLNAHVYTTFGPCWIPGYTYYIQQDFVHLEAPWVHYIIGFLAPHFKFLKVQAPSLCLGVTELIPQAKLERIEADDFTAIEKARYALSLVEHFNDNETLCAIKLVGARLLAEAAEHAEATALLEALESTPSVTDLTNNRRRLKRTREVLSSLLR